MNNDRIGEVEIHPAAQFFPEMPHEELLELIESVKREGVIEPIVFYDGKLLDGRNRVRAANIAGIPTGKIPMRTLKLESNPYLHAWDHNCTRLHYTKEAKAALHARILDESGEWEKLKEQAEDSGREKQRVAATKQHAAQKPGGVDVRQHGGQAQKKPDRRKDTAAAKAAAAAGTSQRTYERGLAKAGVSEKRPRPRKAGKSKHWRLPRSIEALALTLRQKLPSDELALLVRLLTSGEAASAA